MRITSLIVAALMLATSFFSPAAAEVFDGGIRTTDNAIMTWTFNTSGTGRIVDLQLYSQSSTRQWPSNQTVWSIEDDEDHTYTIACKVPEVICYGAWDANDRTVYWGTGYDDQWDKPNACRKCGSVISVHFNLNE